MEQRDQWTADNRDIDTMRRIALDSLRFEEDVDFYAYAEDHQFTVRAACDDLQELAHGKPEEDIAHRPATARSDSFSRNDPCPCGSGKTYRHCCLRKDR